MLKKKEKYVVALVGASGAVGNEMIDVLESRKFPIGRLRLFAVEMSEGGGLEFQGSEIPVEILKDNPLKDMDIAIFSAGNECSKVWAPIMVKKGCVVIDTSSQWRMDPAVPLVVPEVNAHDLLGHKGIISSPSCSMIQMAIVLKPIHDVAKIRRIVVTTFQSVSGTGKRAMDELLQQTIDLLNFKEMKPSVYPHQIAFNCLPHIGKFLENGYTAEEMKLVNETRKIFGDNSIRLTATTVRVPVFRGHSESVNIETEKKLSGDEARAILAAAPGVIVYDAPEKNLYPLAIYSAGKDETYVGRIREDESIENGLNMWIVADNLRKGAALNAVQIAEKLIEMA